jgi:hypothetical protein
MLLRYRIRDYLADGWRAATASEIAAALGTPLREVSAQLDNLTHERVVRPDGEDDRGRVLWQIDLSDSPCDAEPPSTERAAIAARIARLREAKHAKARDAGTDVLSLHELDAVLAPLDCHRTRMRLAAGGAA